MKVIETTSDTRYPYLIQDSWDRKCKLTHKQLTEIGQYILHNIDPHSLSATFTDAELNHLATGFTMELESRRTQAQQKDWKNLCREIRNYQNKYSFPFSIDDLYDIESRDAEDIKFEYSEELPGKLSAMISEVDIP